MDLERTDGRRLVKATKAEGTVRVASFSRLGQPVPAGVDLRGEGFVDFDTDQLWMTDRVVTDRIAAHQKKTSSLLARPLLHLFTVTVERFLKNGGLLLFEGGSLRQREPSGSWSPGMGEVQQPKYPRHPLCAFTPLEKGGGVGEAHTGSEFVRGVRAQRLGFDLPRAAFDEGVWSELNGSAAGRQQQAVQAFAWIDHQCRILRLSFEGRRSDPASEALWCVTELWDWGVSIPADYRHLE
jgi:hypothetical protein